MSKFEYTIKGTCTGNDDDEIEDIRSDMLSIVQNDLATGAAVVEVKMVEVSLAD